MDWYFASLFQLACDTGAPGLAGQVAACWGLVSAEKFAPLGTLTPPVTVAVTDGYVFVASGSTRDPLQWLGNLLGSFALPWAAGTGSAAAYFQGVAAAQYAAARSAILAAAPGRRVVLVGFSLGAASCTLLKPLLAADGVSAACFAIASPRVGTAAFASGYPTTDFQRWQFQADVVPSVPPTTWAGTGSHAGWIPTGPLVTYQHVGAGETLYTPAEIRAGDQIPDTADAALGFSTGLYRDWHNPGLYAEIIRRGLPDELDDGQDEHPNASRYDNLASQTFPDPSPWPWRTAMALTPTGGNLLQLVIGFRDKSAAPGWKETYYFQATDPVAFLSSFLSANQPSNPLSLRAAFMSSLCEIYYVRASRVGSVKAHKLIKFTATTPGADGSASKIAAASITYFGYPANFASRRQFHFRGLPGNYIAGDKLTTDGVEGTKKIESFLNYLERFGSCILSPSIQDSAGIAGCIKAAPHDNITLTLGAPLTVAPGALVQVVGTRATPLLAGEWLTPGTAGVPATTLKLTASSWLVPDADTVGTLRVLNYDTTFGYPLDNYQFNNVGKRNTGRQDFLPRGRRSPQVRRR